MLPQNALYSRKKESAAGRRYRTSIQPQQGSGIYYGGNTITINIPTAPNVLMIPSESVFNFTINGTNSTGNSLAYIRWDSCGSQGIIQRIRVYHGSSLLEDIDNYGQLAKILYDYQVPTDAAFGRHSITGGTRSDALVLPAYATGDFPSTYAAADMPAAVNRLQSVKYQNSGASLIPSSSLANNGTFTKNYSLNLISLVGSLNSNKYLPLFAMSSAPLRVEIQLVSTLNACCATDQTSSSGTSGSYLLWNLTNCEFVGEFLQLSDAAIGMIMSASDSPLQWTVPSFANYQYTAALANAATTQVSIPIAAKFSSLKALVTSVRDASKGVNTAAYYPYTTHPFSMNQVYWRLGSQVVPSKPLSTNEDFAVETLKVFGSLADQMYQPAVDLETFTMNVPVAATNGQVEGSGASNANLGSGSFVVGLDCEIYAAADRDAFFQGINTNNDDIFAVLQFSGAAGAVTTARFDTFALHDKVCVCENGAAYVKF